MIKLHIRSFILFTILLVCWISNKGVDSQGNSDVHVLAGVSNGRYQYSPKQRYSGYYERSSEEWKSRAVAGGGLFMGFDFATKFHQNYSQFNSTYSTNRVCFNAIFSGPNNRPIFDVTDLNDIRSYSNRIELRNVEPPPLYAFVRDGHGSPGLFLCPLTSEQIDQTDCCGPRDAEYCCTFWDTADVKTRIVGCIGLVGLLIFMLVKRIYKKKFSNNNQQANNNEQQQQQQQDVAYIPQSQLLTGPSLPPQAPPMGYDEAVSSNYANDVDQWPIISAATLGLDKTTNQTDQDFSEPPPPYSQAIRM